MIIHKSLKITKLLSIVWLNLWLFGTEYTNALIDEPSPYLQQHAHNPVNWYPWGDEAFAKAQKEHKLIFLSIGYSTCHWCHVMEEESFTDSAVAQLLNRDFVSIKVDREQYPQIDKKYQRIYQALHGKRGGWPLSVFLTPQMEVIDIRTYIPKEEGYGSEGLMTLLPALVALLKDPLALQKQLNHNKIRILAQERSQGESQSTVLGEVIARLRAQLERSFDQKSGGFGSHPKFPEVSKIALLLDLYRLYDDRRAYQMATTTLTKMAEGGLYDQIGGGFFRYTVDEAWQIPHFEKMLYTNAELIRVYTQAYLLSGKPLYKRVVKETIEAMQHHFMRDGLFVSASDADSASSTSTNKEADGKEANTKEEGSYYLYVYDKIKSALLKAGWDSNVLEDALAYLGIEEDGNIDGEYALAHITSQKEPPRIEALKVYLKNLRSKRDFPFVDTKINTAWNAMMITALFEASKIDPRYGAEAKRMLHRLWQTMAKEGVLYHQRLPSKAPTQKALLEDYAYLIEALLSAYERSYDDLYLRRAKQLSREVRKRFYKVGVWYLSDDGASVAADHDDRYYTAPLSVLYDDLLRLAALDEDIKLYAFVSQEIRSKGRLLHEDPASASRLVHDLLRLEHGDVVIHAAKKKLQNAQPKIDRIRYPFVLSKVQATNAYLACRINSCFAEAKKIEALIAKIEAISHAQEKKGAQLWKHR